MEQTYGFWGFILYLLSFLGCGGGSYNDYNYEPPSATDETTEIIIEQPPIYEADYHLSLEYWQNQQDIHGNSYEYTLFFTNSIGTYSESTTVVVKNGAVFSREKKAYLKNHETKEVKVMDKETWKENQKQLGTHGNFPKTLDELYEDCSTILTLDASMNNIIFTMDHNQLISVCGYSHEACADDCFKGFNLQDFKWLD